MFYIDSEKQKPNHQLALEKAQEWCNRGFRFNTNAWREFTDLANESREKLLGYGLKNPDSPKEVEWFLRSFNSLEISANMYNLKKAHWDLTIDALENVSEKFMGIPEIAVLYEYKKALGISRSFQTLERMLKGSDIVHPKVKTTVTNRIMFVEPYLSGLPKKCRPFKAMHDSSVLLSVDVQAQEPNIIVNWFGSPVLRNVAATETDIYTGVAKAALLPRVSIIEGTGVSITPISKGVAWVWGTGDSLLYLENIHQSFLLPNPTTAIGVFESGMRRPLPIKWGETVGGKIEGVVDVTRADISELSFKLLGNARDEVKEVWNLLAYGGSINTAKAKCTTLDGTELVTFIKNELRLSKKGQEDACRTYFGTELKSEERLSYRSIQNRRIQGTGADIIALLIERFYSEKRPEGVDIYITRYDELVLEVPLALFDTYGGAGVKEYFTDVFEHKVDTFTPFRVDVELF